MTFSFTFEDDHMSIRETFEDRIGSHANLKHCTDTACNGVLLLDYFLCPDGFGGVGCLFKTANKRFYVRSGHNLYLIKMAGGAVIVTIIIEIIVYRQLRWNEWGALLPLRLLAGLGFFTIATATRADQRILFQNSHTCACTHNHVIMM